MPTCPHARSFAIAATALLCACFAGEVVAPVGPRGAGQTIESSRQEALRFECDPGADAPVLPLRRLARVEYLNALADLLRATTSAATAEAVLAEVQGALTALPPDAVSKVQPFARMDQAVSQAHVDAYYGAGQAVARQLTASGERLTELLGGTCEGGTCIDAFIERFGRRAARRPLKEEERAFYREVYAAEGLDPAGVADVVAVMLNAPAFLYEVQLGGPAEPGASSAPLSDYELASRLSFQFWRSAPDDYLLDAAERGALRDEAGYEAAIEHVLSQPRAKETLASFAREWLDLDALRPLDALVGDPRFNAFAGDRLPSPELREEMIRDVTDSLVYHALERNEPLLDWLLSPYSFARSEELAAIYETSVWDGVSEPPRFDDPERVGLLTRAALLATGTWNTRPIKKGVLIRERVLCDHLGSPPANAAAAVPESDELATSREIVEGLTEQPNSSCAGCHVRQINPLGFATEGFDALGRRRDEERVFDDAGELVTELPIDSATTPRVWLEDETAGEGAADLAELVAESGKVEACFARQLVRFAEARTEQESGDGCALEALRASLAEGEGVRDALAQYALLPRFRERRLPPP